MIDTVRSVLPNLRRSMNDPRAYRPSQSISELYPNQRGSTVYAAALLSALAQSCDSAVARPPPLGGASLFRLIRRGRSLSPSYHPSRALPGSMRARIFVRCRRLPAGQRSFARPMDLDLQRIAFGSIVGVTGAAVAAGTGRERNQQINLGKKFDEIAGPNGTCFHKVLMRVAGIASAHEYVHHVVNMNLSLFERQIPLGRERPRQIRVTAVVVFRPIQ